MKDENKEILTRLKCLFSYKHTFFVFDYIELVKQYLKHLALVFMYNIQA